MYFAGGQTRRIMRLGMWLLMLTSGLGALSLAQERRPVTRDGQVQDSARRNGPRLQEPKTLRDKAARREALKSRQPRTPSERGKVSDERESSEAPQVLNQELHPVVRDEHRRMFETIRSGLMSGRIGSISEFMGPQVYVNLRGGESGYFSANQAHYVLENYLRNRKFSNLEFSTLGEAEATPYASGSAGFNHKGSRETAQVYISLSEAGGRWVIGQIKIY